MSSGAEIDTDRPDPAHEPAPLHPDLVLAALYAVVLERHPDPGGLRYWSDLLADAARREDGPDAVARILDGFMSTEEALRKLAARLSTDAAFSRDRRIADTGRAALRAQFLHPAPNRLRNAISLGTNCYAASLLARFGAREWSGPFDWIFSTPAMVRDCIRDRFNEYLDHAHYSPVPPAERADPDLHRARHVLFETRYAIQAPIFNHTDAHTAPGQQYLRRCVDRFETALGGAAPCFLQVTPDRPLFGSSFNETAALLRALNPRAMLVQVTILEPRLRPPSPELLTLNDAPGGRLLGLTPTSDWNATRFTDLLDDLVLMRGIEATFADLAAP